MNSLQSLINRALNPIREKISHAVLRAIVSGIDDSKAMQLLKISCAEDDATEKVEHPQEYGLSSVAPYGGESIAVRIGGRADDLVALISSYSKSRPTNLETGEVCLWSDFGQRITLKKDGSISIAPASGKKIILDADVEITGKADVTGIVTGSDCRAGTVSLLNHVHSGTSLVYNVSTGSIIGFTGAPV
ncbi:MAG: phage baseplate assembly protein [Synergistaceae bacterium]